MVYETGQSGWFALAGSSSTRTATEDGDQGAFLLGGFRSARASAFAGPFVEFGGRTRLMGGGSVQVAPAVTFEPFYDGQFIALAAGWQTGYGKVTVHRSGTGRFGISLGRGF